MYGTQTWYKECEVKRVFENDVKMYGTQTKFVVKEKNYTFENDVKMYGTQTATKLEGLHISLRMM